MDRSYQAKGQRMVMIRQVFEGRLSGWVGRSFVRVDKLGAINEEDIHRLDAPFAIQLNEKTEYGKLVKLLVSLLKESVFDAKIYFGELIELEIDPDRERLVSKLCETLNVIFVRSKTDAKTKITTGDIEKFVDVVVSSFGFLWDCFIEGKNVRIIISHHECIEIEPKNTDAEEKIKTFLIVEQEICGLQPAR